MRAEKIGKVDRPLLADEGIVLPDRAARGQRPPLGGHPLEMATEFDLLGEERRSRVAGCALARPAIADTGAQRSQEDRRMSVADPFAVETARPYGDLPEWNLADLYPSRDSPELQAALGRAEA